MIYSNTNNYFYILYLSPSKKFLYRTSSSGCHLHLRLRCSRSLDGDLSRQLYLTSCTVQLLCSTIGNLTYVSNLITTLTLLVFSVKDLQSLGAAETKLLYTLHWILLFAGDECADVDSEENKKVVNKLPYYLFSVPSISVRYIFTLFQYFVYLYFPFVAFHLPICTDCASFERV